MIVSKRGKSEGNCLDANNRDAMRYNRVRSFGVMIPSRLYEKQWSAASDEKWLNLRQALGCWVQNSPGTQHVKIARSNYRCGFWTVLPSEMICRLTSPERRISIDLRRCCNARICFARALFVVVFSIGMQAKKASKTSLGIQLANAGTAAVASIASSQDGSCQWYNSYTLPIGTISPLNSKRSTTA